MNTIYNSIVLARFQGKGRGITGDSRLNFRLIAAAITFSFRNIYHVDRSMFL